MAIEGHIVVTKDDDLNALKFYIVRIADKDLAIEAVSVKTDDSNVSEVYGPLDSNVIQKWENVLKTIDGKEFPPGSIVEITTWFGN